MAFRTSRYLAVLVACGVIALAATVQAATVQSLFQETNTASDNDAEFVVDNDSSGFISAGDFIRGAFDISTLNHGSANLGGSTVNDQWSGVFSLKVRSVTNITVDSHGLTHGDIYFEPDPGFAAYIASLDTDPTTVGQQAPNGAAPGTGTIIRMWENPNFGGSGDTIDYNTNYGDVNRNVGLAANGSFFWDMGFIAGFATSADNFTTAGEGWEALGAVLNLGTSIVNSGTSIGQGNAAINLIPGSAVSPYLGYQVNDLTGAPAGAMTNFLATTNIRGAHTAGYDNAGFFAASDASFTFNIVPLPAAVWSGFLLLGLFGVSRMRRRRLAA